ncbi:MAG: glycosyl transferase [Lysobacterales bacterium]|jgi:GT2 family glycosyltransferase|nr:MAG: glycosyl transferase [Xanthomonadales bacterium]
MSEAPELAAVVVACDSGPWLAECVRRLRASQPPVELVVVDNASRDGSTKTLAEQGVRVLRNPRNLGFAAACNQGARASTAPYLAFVNPDVLLEPETLARLLAKIRPRREIGLIGACLYDAEGRRDPACRRRDPTPWRSLMSITGLSRLSRRWPALSGIEADPVPMPEHIEYPDAVSGALILMPRAAFEKVGGFDEGYFLHGEDLDLCRRVRQAGLRVALAADVEALHLRGTSSRRRPVFVAWHKHRGMVRYFRRHERARTPWPWRHLVVPAIWAWFGLRLPLLLVRGLAERLRRAS